MNLYALALYAIVGSTTDLITAGQTSAPVCIEYCERLQFADTWAPAVDGTPEQQIEAYKQGDDGTDTQPIIQDSATLSPPADEEKS